MEVRPPGACAGGTTMKYMIMMFGCLGEAMPDRSPAWIEGMGQLMGTLESEMREAGEYVAGNALADPGRATTVRLDGDTPVSTDGPFAEVKESLAGYWVIDSTRERAVEIATRVVAYTGYPMEVRQLMHESAES
jgi:hypothetical protein